MTIKEFTERLQLAWNILRSKDDALTMHVRREIAMVDESAALDCANVARVFALAGHSGGSAPIVIPWIQKALSWEPIAPLTGDEDEWCDVSEIMGRACWQNKRFGRVFKEADGSAYDIHGKMFVEKDGACYTSKESTVKVEFPYTPKTDYIDV